MAPCLFFSRVFYANVSRLHGAPLLAVGPDATQWLSYFSILFGLLFDWAYWFMTALCFRPCDYAQLWDSETGCVQFPK